MREHPGSKYHVPYKGITLKCTRDMEAVRIVIWAPRFSYSDVTLGSLSGGSRSQTFRIEKTRVCHKRCPNLCGVWSRE